MPSPSRNDRKRPTPRALEEIITGLDLRSHADFSGRSYATLQKAAEDPGAIDVQALLDELANNLADEIPVTMSSPVTAHFLMDSLYGFSIESAHVMGYFQRNDATGKLRAQLYEEPSQPGREPWMKMARACRLTLICQIRVSHE